MCGTGTCVRTHVYNRPAKSRESNAETQIVNSQAAMNVARRSGLVCERGAGLDVVVDKEVEFISVPPGSSLW